MYQHLSSYRIFYTVANTKNISHAAKELYISQPAISKSIQKLEESLGAQLFARSSRGVSLTDAGELLYAYVKSAFETLALGESQLRRSIELGVGHLTIGASSTLCKHILLPFLREFIREYPQIHLSISCQSTNQMLELLAEEKLDIGLIGKPGNRKHLHFHSIQEIEDTFVATKEYLDRQNAHGMQKGRWLENATFILLDKGNMTRQHIDGYCQEQRLPLQEVVEVSSMDLVIEMSKIGLGVGCVIKSFVEQELKSGALVEIPLHPPIPKREIGFAYKRDAKMSQPLQTFLSFYENGYGKALRHPGCLA